jgi:hypothetical protein
MVAPEEPAMGHQTGRLPARFCQPGQFVEPAAASVLTYMLPPPAVPIANTWAWPLEDPAPIASPAAR